VQSRSFANGSPNGSPYKIERLHGYGAKRHKKGWQFYTGRQAPNFFTLEKMGQKVHPIGFRVGITKKHQSNWFAPFQRRQYAQAIQEDRLLRQTLLKLFPTLFSSGKNDGRSQDRDRGGMGPGAAPSAPRVTQIQLERGLLPYEIGIRIHTDNCAALKASLDRLQVSDDVLQQLQWSRQSLVNLKTNCPSLAEAPKATGGKGEKNDMKKRRSPSAEGRFARKGKPGMGVRGRQGQKMGQGGRMQGRPSRGSTSAFGGGRSKNDSVFNPVTREKSLRSPRSRKNRAWLSAPKFKQVRAMRRRVLKRRAFRYWQSCQRHWRRTLRIVKRGTTFRVRLPKQLALLRSEKPRRSKFGQNKKLRRPWLRWVRQGLPLSRKPKISVVPNVLRPISWVDMQRTTGSPRQKVVARTVAQRLNVAFLLHLRQQTQVAKRRLETGAPGLGYRRKWSVQRLARWKKLGRSALKRLWRALNRRGMLHAAQLRQRFYANGRLSLAVIMPFLQWIRVAKMVKALWQTLPKPAPGTRTTRTRKKRLQAQKAQWHKPTRRLAPGRPPEGSSSWSVFSLRQRVQKMPDEMRKIKLIGHLTELVQKHRRQHIYHYVSMLAEAKRDLEKVRQLTKMYAPRLFEGLDLNDPERVATGVTEALQKSFQQPEWERQLTDSILVDLQKQRVMAQRTLQLTPRISLKFYQVKAAKVVSKASTIAASIVDDMEKRKAFRRVIKTAKERAMEQPNVRGIKIQVAGRLNGAEIARTEWVRGGRVPLQTLRANIDYCYQPAYTIYGVIGVKVWVFKGYSKVRGSFLFLKQLPFKQLPLKQLPQK
jgi:ribosomal protein S3